jgi:hypothetical protein
MTKSAFGALVSVERQYALSRQTAVDDKITSAALPQLLAEFYSGRLDAFEDDPFEKLNRGLAYLCFQVAERVAQTIKRRMALLPVMVVDLGDALVRCRKQRKPAHQVEAYLRRELSNSPKHERDAGFIILDAHKGKGKDRGKMVCRQSADDPWCDAPVRDLREGRGLYRKPKGVDLQTSKDDDRERQRFKQGFYLAYTERAEDALKFLALTPDEFEIVRFASAGDSPEDIVRMSRFNAKYVNGVLASIPARLRAHKEQTESRSRYIRENRRG